MPLTPLRYGAAGRRGWEEALAGDRIRLVAAVLPSVVGLPRVTRYRSTENEAGSGAVPRSPPRRHPLLQFLEPVEDDDEARLLDEVEGDEELAVG